MIRKIFLGLILCCGVAGAMETNVSEGSESVLTKRRYPLTDEEYRELKRESIELISKDSISSPEKQKSTESKSSSGSATNSDVINSADSEVDKQVSDIKLTEDSISSLKERKITESKTSLDSEMKLDVKKTSKSEDSEVDNQVSGIKLTEDEIELAKKAIHDQEAMGELFAYFKKFDYNTSKQKYSAILEFWKDENDYEMMDSGRAFIGYCGRDYYDF